MDLQSLAQMYDLTNLDESLGDSLWSPIDVAHINNFVLRAAAIQGEYHWHSHQDDELFLVYQGHIVIDTEKGPLELHTGQVAVIPKGMQHKPRSIERSIILMFEPASLNSNGD